MSQPESKIPARKITRRLWRGVLQFEEEDVPPDRRAFNAFGKSVILWLEYSRELFRSARLLMDETPRTNNDLTHIFRAPIALMLGAYTLETTLKMIIVGEHCEASGLTMDSEATKDFLPPIHDLVRLAQQSQLRINRTDRKLLGALTRYSTWAGRYTPFRSPSRATTVRPLSRRHGLHPKPFRTRTRRGPSL